MKGLREEGCFLGGVGGVLGDFVGADELGIHGGDLHCEIVGQGLELVSSGDEIGLAVYFDHGAELATGVDVEVDESLVGGAARLLRGDGEALLGEELFGRFYCAIGRFEGTFTVHDAGPGTLPELSNGIG